MIVACSTASYGRCAPAHDRLTCFSPLLYKMRNKVERFFSKLKQFRRIAARYDKLAENYLAVPKTCLKPHMAAR